MKPSIGLKYSELVSYERHRLENLLSSYVDRFKEDIQKPTPHCESLADFLGVPEANLSIPKESQKISESPNVKESESSSFEGFAIVSAKTAPFSSSR